MPGGDASSADGRGWRRAGGAGFFRRSERGTARVVWARGRVATEECPTSFVTPASMELVEKYFAWKDVCMEGGGGERTDGSGGGGVFGAGAGVANGADEWPAVIEQHNEAAGPDGCSAKRAR